MWRSKAHQRNKTRWMLNLQKIWKDLGQLATVERNLIYDLSLDWSVFDTHWKGRLSEILKSRGL